MNNFTMNSYEMKRDIVNFSKKLSEGVNKSTSKFVMDMEYGLAKSGSCLISEISRSLNEDIKLNNTIERLCNNLSDMYEEERNVIWNNYLKEVKKNMDYDNPIVLFDDSDINKEYSKKLEDLDRVIDGSRKDKKIVNGYHVCEATILTKNEKQPLSIYSKIYSCKSKEFESKNKYTMESIKAAEELVGEDFIGVFDRGYDDNKIINYMSNHKFVIRLDDERTLLFKGKKIKVYEIAKTRKGKIKMTALFDDNEEKEEVIKIVRLYLSRWRIEEHFRGNKQEYDFENMRVRTLKSMNNLNMFLTMYLGYIAILADKMDRKLLVIKIIEASKSLRNKIIVWLSQISRGIKEILKYSHTGIKQWQEIEVREKYKQIELKL